MSATSKPKLYNPRHPERTLLYQTVAEHYETWLELASAGQFDGQCDHHTPKPFVRKAFATYLECGIFAHGFARARCEDCGHDYFVAFSCKGRGVCPSCTTRRMVETAAHLNDHAFPRLPDFDERKGLSGQQLVHLFAWDEPTFLRMTEGGPIRRIGHERWLRNVAVALGNALRQADSAELRSALQSRAHDPSELVREHVAWALAV